MKCEIETIRRIVRGVLVLECLIRAFNRQDRRQSRVDES